MINEKHKFIIAKNNSFTELFFAMHLVLSRLCGVCWTKFETISSKIQMIKTTKKDSAGRNNLSGVSDSPCLG